MRWEFDVGCTVSEEVLRSKIMTRRIDYVWALASLLHDSWVPGKDDLIVTLRVRDQLAFIIGGFTFTNVRLRKLRNQWSPLSNCAFLNSAGELVLIQDSRSIISILVESLMFASEQLRYCDW